MVLSTYKICHGKCKNYPLIVCCIKCPVSNSYVDA